MEAQSIKTNLINADVLLACGIIGVLGIMLMPLPVMLMDILLAVNITISILILFVALYSVEPLDFSTFPSILLITTLFRLSLNLASTRLILLGGNTGERSAGEIINAFGKTVVGGNYFVGVIVFLILVLVNFIVITKGAGRIAEVAARFALDAMPGKQMAIDADLNAGVIDDIAAKERREKIQRESDFYGAMDGASKFVRGDAIASLIITAINIIGGLVVGVMIYNMDITNAAETYTTLTVGDGLVSQIPSLIISTAAGITVSKAGRQNRLGLDFNEQLLSGPRVLGLVTGTMILFLFVEGMPKIPFLLLGTLFGALAWRSYAAIQKAAHRREAQEEQAAETQEQSEDVSGLLPVDTLGLELGYALIPLVDTDQDGELLERIKAIRRQTALDYGFVVPSVHIKDNLQLAPGEYSIVVKGIEAAKGEMLPGHFLAMKSGEVEEEIEGEATVEPTFGLPAIWITEQQREPAQIAGYTVVDIPTVISTHLTEIIKSNAFEFLGRQEVQKILDQVAENEPKLVEELTPAILNLGIIQRTLQNLLKEKVSIRDMTTILETLSDYGPIHKNPEVLNEFVRQALAKSITRQYVNEEGALPVMTLHPILESILDDAIQETPQGSYLSISPEHAQELIQILQGAEEQFAQYNYQPIILCSPKIRPQLKRLTDRMIPHLVVLSHNEVSHDVNIETIGIVKSEQMVQADA